MVLTLPFSMFMSKMKELTSTSSDWIIVLSLLDNDKLVPEHWWCEGNWEQQAIARRTGKTTLARSDAYLYHSTRWAVVLHHCTAHY